MSCFLYAYISLASSKLAVLLKGLLVGLCLFFSLNLSYAQTNFCTQNKITNGTFDNADNWTFGGSWTRSGNRANVNDNGTHELTSNVIQGLCSNTPKQVKFKFQYSYYGDADVRVFLGSQEIFHVDMSNVPSQGVGASYYIATNNVLANVNGLVMQDGYKFDNENVYNIILNVYEYNGSDSETLRFEYIKTSGTRRVYIDDVEVYEAQPPKPSNPIATNLTYTIWEYADLTSVEPAPGVWGDYAWHTVASNPTSSTLVTDPTAVGKGTYYMYQETCSRECYSLVADQSVIVTKSTETPVLECDCEKRKSIDITNSSSNDLADYQVRIDVPFEAGINTDFSDIRFTLADKITPIPHWVEVMQNGVSAVVWVKMPTIPANSTEEIFMYYDCTDAVISDPNNVFLFFDDMNFSNGWNNIGNNTLDFVTINGSTALKKQNENDYNGGWKSLGAGVIIDNFKLITREKRQTQDANAGGAWNRYGLENSSFDGYTLARVATSSGNRDFGYEARDNQRSRNTSQISLQNIVGNWYRTELNRCQSSNFNEAVFYNDDRSEIGRHFGTIANHNYSNFDRVTVRGGHNYYIDFMAVANYQCDEPVVSIDSSYENTEPTASISAIHGDICEAETSTLVFTFTNISSEYPATIIYNDGTQSFTVSQLSETTYEISVDPEETTTYALTSFQTFCPGEIITNTVEIKVDDEKPKITTCPPDVDEVDGCTTGALASSTMPAYSEVKIDVLKSVFTAAGGVATDNCPDNLIYQYVDSKENLNPCGIRVIRLWNVVDAAGNSSASCTQIIKIINKKAPEVPDFETKVISCTSELIDPPLPTVYDACGNELTGKFVTKVSQPTDIDCEGTRTYTYRFTDCANNSTDWKFTYIVKSQDFKDKMPSDNVGSTVNCTSNIVDVEPPPVKDNCGNTLTPTQVTITPSNYQQLSCYQGDVVFSYVYEDCSGTFSNTYKRVVKVKNKIPPTGFVPDDVTYHCIDDVPQAIANNITGVTSSCGGTVSISIKESNNGGEGCPLEPYILKRKYILEDCSGLTNTYTQTITVINNEAPTFTNCPGSISEEADDVGGNFAIISIPTPTASSKCGGNATVTYTLSGDTSGSGSDIINQSFNVGVTTVEYTATDNCGNQATCILQVTVRSNYAPEIICPGDIVTSCYDDLPEPYGDLDAFKAAGGTVTDTDGIEASTFTLVSQVDNNLTCPRTIIRTYHIADNNGHSSACAQTIIINDEKAPTYTGALNKLTVEGCQKKDEPIAYTTVQQLLDNGLTSLSDNCTASNTLLINSSETYSGTCPIVIKRTYTIEDACDNQTSVTQEIDINDTTPPTVSGTISLIEKPGCSVSDFPNHVETVPELIEKYGAVSGTVQKAIEISDNCTPIDQMGLTYTQTITMGCPLVLHRTYTISDKCGNKTSISKVVHIYDNEAPTYTNKLRDKELDGCGTSALSTYPPVTTEVELEALGLNYQDNCTATEDLIIKFISDNTVSQTDCYTEVVRTYTISDACSNTLTVSQTIKISDDTAPVVTGTLSDVTKEGCDVGDAPSAAANVSALETLGLLISDSCSTDSELKVTHKDIASGNCPIIIKRIYTISDKCENAIELPVQTITIEDTQSPTISISSYREVVEGCRKVDVPIEFQNVSGLETLPGLLITDTCTSDQDLRVTSIDADTVSGCTLITKRQYTIKDECGNATTFIHTIIVEDTQSPTFDALNNISYCVNNIQEASFNEMTNGDVNTPPDYYEFESGYTGLDVDNLKDNCNNPVSLTWEITPSSNGATVSGTGQPSESIGGKRLWLDVAAVNPMSSYVEKQYIITYTATDCNGNSTQKTTQIKITPRPKIDKINN